MLAAPAWPCSTTSSPPAPTLSGTFSLDPPRPRRRPTHSPPFMMIPLVRVSEQPQDLHMNTNPAHCCTSDPTRCRSVCRLATRTVPGDKPVKFVPLTHLVFLPIATTPPRLMLPSSRPSPPPPMPTSTPTLPGGTSTLPLTRTSSPPCLAMPPSPTLSTAPRSLSSP